MLRIFYFLQNVLVRIYSLMDSSSKSGDFLDSHQSVQALLESGKSLIRWGDGESIVALGGDLYFQRNSWRLMLAMWQIARRGGRGANYLVAVPRYPLVSSKASLLADRKYYTWLKTRFVYSLGFARNIPLLEANMFREDSELDVRQIESLWRNATRIAFVHSNFKYYSDFRQSCSSKEVYFVPVYGANAMRTISSIESKVMEIAKGASENGERFCALVSAGPAGKYLVLKLSNQGVRALDMGHFFDYKFYGLTRAKSQ